MCLYTLNFVELFVCVNVLVDLSVSWIDLVVLNVNYELSLSLCLFMY